jgi:hypothetical protein
MTLHSVRQMWRDSTSKTHLLIMASLVTVVIFSIGLAFGVYGRMMYPAMTTNSNAVPAAVALPVAITEQERYYEAPQQSQALLVMPQSAPQPDTTAYYLRAQEEQAIRDFWARAVVPDTTAYYLRAQEEQAIRNFRQRSK